MVSVLFCSILFCSVLTPAAPSLFVYSALARPSAAHWPEGWRIVFGPGHTPRVHGHRGAAGSAAAVFHAIAHEGRGRTAKGIDGIAFMLDKLVVASLARPSGVA